MSSSLSEFEPKFKEIEGQINQAERICGAGVNELSEVEEQQFHAPRGIPQRQLGTARDEL